MIVVDSPNPAAISYPRRTITRAQRAIQCAPFQRHLFVTMGQQSVPLLAISGRAGVQAGYTQRALAELRTESSLLWLIQVGVLRREVDGQGITDSFRLTPLGRHLIHQLTDWLAPSWLDRLWDLGDRWLRLPLS